MSRPEPFRIVTAVRTSALRCGASERAARDVACYLMRVDGHWRFERIIDELEGAVSKAGILSAINSVSLAIITGSDERKLARTVELARRQYRG